MSVAAIAADVQSVVLLNDRGQMQRYSGGVAIAGFGWRVGRITNDQVIFESLQPFQGSPLHMRVTLGQSVDLGAAEKAVTASQTPQSLPRMIDMRPPKYSSTSGH